MRKLKIWHDYNTWDEAEIAWDIAATEAAVEQPIKRLKNMPKMVGIVPETAKNLKWKSLKWMLTQDKKREIRRGILKHPLRYGWAFLKSVMRSKSYKREGDFFLYGIKNIDTFKELIKQTNHLLVVGFSYCHKPFECPSARFTPDCIHDRNNPICQQCFIGKAMNALPADNKVIPLIIPTVHYIGGKIFDIAHAHPDKKILFIITACEMTLEMFGDWGNMVGIQGLGVRLGGRICNTMKAFELSEQGIKPGLTVVEEATQHVIMDLLKKWTET